MTAHRSATGKPARRLFALTLFLTLLVWACATTAFATTSVLIVNPQNSENVSGLIAPAMYLVNGTAFDADSVNLFIFKTGMAQPGSPTATAFPRRGVWEYSWDISGAGFVNGDTYTIKAVGVKKGKDQASVMATLVKIDKPATGPSGGLTLLPSSVDSSLYLNATTIGGSVNVQYRARSNAALTTINYGETTGVANASTLDSKFLNSDNGATLYVTYPFNSAIASFRTLFVKFADAANTSALFQRTILVDTLSPVVGATVSSSSILSGAAPRTILSGIATDPNSGAVAPGSNYASGIADVKILAFRNTDAAGVATDPNDLTNYLVFSAQITYGATAGAAVAWQAQLPDANGSALQAGIYDFTVMATDNAGNVSAAVNKTNVAINTAVPNTPSFATPAAGALLGGGTGNPATIAITGTAGNPAGASSTDTLTTHVFVDGSEITPLGTDTVVGTSFSVTWNITNFPNATNDGPHNITAYTVNSAGAAGPTATRTVTVDNIVPSLAFTSPASGATVGGKVFPINFTVSDLHLAAWTLKDAGNNTIATGTTSGSFTGLWNTTLAGAASPLTLSASDSATPANANSITRAFTINNAAPTITANPPAPASPFGTTSATATPVKDPVQVAVAVTDPAAGNSVSWNAFVDNTAPDTTTATLLSSGTGKVFTTPQVGSFASLTLPPTLGQAGLASGVHSLTFVAQNSFGVYSAPQTVFVSINNNAPNTPSFATPTAGALLGGAAPNPATFTITGAASNPAGAPAGDVLTTHVFVDGSEITPLGTDTVVGTSFSVTWNITNFPNATNDGPHNITAYTVNSAGAAGPTATRTVTVDNIVPSLAFTSPASGATVGGKVFPINFTVSDLHLAAWTLKDAGNNTIATGTTSGSFTGLWNTTLAGAASPLTLSASDSATPANANSITRAFTINNAAPTITANPPSPAPAFGTTSATATPVKDPVQVAVAVTDPAAGNSVSWNAFVDNTAPDTTTATLLSSGTGKVFTTPQVGSFASLTLPPTLGQAGLASGVHSLTFVAQNSFGVYSAPQTVFVSINNNAPNKPVITSPTAIALLGGAAPNPATFTITGAASNPAGAPAGDVLTTHVFVDGSEITPLGTDTVVGTSFSVTWNITNFPNATNDGPHTITAFTTNSANAPGPTSDSLSVTVDNIVPSLAFTSPASGATVGGKVFPINFTVSDLHLAAWTLKDAGNNTIATGTTSGSFTGLWNTTLAGAASPLTLSASDSATPANANSITRAFTINNAAPTITANPPSPAPAFGTTSATATPVADPVQVAVAVTDPAAGNSVSWNAFVDNTAPDTTTATLLSSGTGKVFTTPQVGSFASLTLPPTLGQAGLASGVHSLTFVAQNSFGVYSAPQTVFVSINNNLPNRVVISAPTPGLLIGGAAPNPATFTITGTASNPAGAPAGDTLSTHVFVDGSEITPTAGVSGATFSVAWDTTNFPTTPNDGPHTITAYTVNSAGKRSPLPDTAVAVTVDNIVPSLAFTSPASGAMVGGKVFPINFTVSDLHLAAWTLKDAGNNTIATGTTSGSFTGLWNTTLAGAASPLTLSASDSATPANANSITRAFTINNAAPTITATHPGTAFGTTSATATPVADPVQVAVAVTDPAAGNSVSWNAFVDNTAPDTTTATLLSSGTGKVFTTPQVGSFASLTLPPTLGQAGLASGVHSLTFVAQNSFGVYSAPQTVFVSINNTAPNKPVITSPTAGALLGANVFITGTASNPAGAPAGDVLTTHVFVDGSEITPTAGVSGATFSVLWTTGAFKDGQRSISAYTVNPSGTKSATTSLTVTVDNTAPIITGLTVTPSVVSASNSTVLSAITNGASSAANGLRILVVGGQATVTATITDNTTEDLINPLAAAVKLYRKVPNSTQNTFLGTLPSMLSSTQKPGQKQYLGQTTVSAPLDSTVQPNGSYFLEVIATDFVGSTTRAYLEIQIINGSSVPVGGGTAVSATDAALLAFAPTTAGLTNRTPSVPEVTAGLPSPFRPFSVETVNLKNLNYPVSTGMFDQYGVAVSRPDSRTQGLQTMYTARPFILEASIFQSVNATLNEPIRPAAVAGDIPSLGVSQASIDTSVPFTYSLSRATPGLYQYVLIATDAVNKAAAPALLSVVYDPVPPTLTFQSPTLGQTFSPGDVLTLRFEISDVKPNGPNDPAQRAPIMRDKDTSGAVVNLPRCVVTVQALDAKGNSIGDTAPAYSLLRAVSNPSLQDAAQSGSAIVTGDAFTKYTVTWQIRLFSKFYSAGVKYRINIANAQDAAQNSIPTQTRDFTVGN